jgi:hypothetical protein
MNNNIKIGDLINALTITGEVIGRVIRIDGTLITIIDDKNIESSTSIHVCRKIS